MKRRLTNGLALAIALPAVMAVQHSPGRTFAQVAPAVPALARFTPAVSPLSQYSPMLVMSSRAFAQRTEPLTWGISPTRASGGRQQVAGISAEPAVSLTILMAQATALDATETVLAVFSKIGEIFKGSLRMLAAVVRRLRQRTRSA